MIKKILFGTMAIAISSLAFASGDAFVPAPTPDYFSGIYAGIGGGVAYTVGTLDSTMQSDTNVMLEDGASAESWVVGPLKQKSDIGKITGNGNALFGWLMSQHSSYTLVNNVPVYPASAYHIPMLIMPIAMVLGLVMALLAKETHCNPVE